MSRHPVEIDVEFDSPTTDESVGSVIITNSDPTATPCEWQATGMLEVPDTGSWVEGNWEPDTWDGNMATAVSPAMQELSVPPGVKTKLWVRWVVPGERPERLAGVVLLGPLA